MTHKTVTFNKAALWTAICSVAWTDAWSAFVLDAPNMQQNINSDLQMLQNH